MVTLNVNVLQNPVVVVVVVVVFLLFFCNNCWGKKQT